MYLGNRRGLLAALILVLVLIKTRAGTGAQSDGGACEYRVRATGPGVHASTGYASEGRLSSGPSKDTGYDGRYQAELRLLQVTGCVREVKAEVPGTMADIKQI